MSEDHVDRTFGPDDCQSVTIHNRRSDGCPFALDEILVEGTTVFFPILLYLRETTLVVNVK